MIARPISGREPSQRHVGGGRGFLHEDGGGDELLGRMKAADRKILGRALSLNAVVRVGRNGVLAERIAFKAVHLLVVSDFRPTNV